MLPLRRYDADIEFVRSRTPQGSVCRDDSNGLPQYWCLERILDSRVQCGCSDDGVIAAQQKEYLCKWFGYGEEHASWHALSELSQCSLQLQQYGMEPTAVILATAAADANASPFYEPLD